MTDRRAELGLDPEGLRQRHCPSCGSMVAVSTHRDSDGTKHYSCVPCGHSLGAEAAGSFNSPEYPDA
jgi:predicted RNA-binding Zn-ribbon protein involved in translation (DUF1610 family)